ncbi:MAG: anthranilate synthase component I, partial [Rhizobiaceae bacterium]
MVVTLEDGSEQYVTGGGIAVTRSKVPTPYAGAIEAYIDALNSRRGAVFSSNYEYPGRYTRWDTAIVDPPVMITARGRDMVIEALNGRGEIILPWIEAVLRKTDDVSVTDVSAKALTVKVSEPSRTFTEEERSRVPSVFTVLRSIVALFFSDLDASLGLYGAFGYDLCFQFDPIKFKLKRPDDQRDLVLFLPDEVLVVDHYSAKAWHERYDFELGGKSTSGLSRETADMPFVPATHNPGRGDHEPGEYAELVKKAMESFRRGDLFEVVPGQTFYERCQTAPSEISRRLKLINPSPYS